MGVAVIYRISAMKISNRYSLFFILMSCLFLSACDTGVNYAPVTEIASIEPVPSSGVHRVVHGESLYEIAWRYGLDYRTLASLNHLHSPYILHTGQYIILRGKASLVFKPAPPLPIKIFSHPGKIAWLWPVNATAEAYVLHNKGIDIPGKMGTPILATAAGEVVYAGDGLRGYGNLIIIKHNNVYLSAYAHNKKMLVKEGQFVSQGQKIAEMGSTGTNKVMLHFEIRQAGNPVNPLSLLTGRV